MFVDFFPENGTVYEIYWKTIIDPDRLHIKIGRMRAAYKTPKAINTHSEYVILVAFCTAAVVRRRRLSSNLYVDCLPCLKCGDVIRMLLLCYKTPLCLSNILTQMGCMVHGFDGQKTDLVYGE
jgi:hypothetical protein